nr:acyltransferase [uncultured Mucilaginibacter sp.]
MATIKQLDQGRKNNFDLLRFLAAVMVIFSHSYLIVGKFEQEPLAKTIGFMDFGALGVRIFFVISGYLITKSMLRQPTLGSFVWARALRIFPGLLVAAVFCAFIIGPISTTLSLSDYFANSRVYDFAWRLLTVHNLNNTLPGVFETLPYAAQINGSLWTLAGELLLYAAVLLLGVIILLWRRQLRALADAIPAILLVVAFFWGIVYAPWYMDFVWAWAALFLLGGLAYLFSGKIIVNIPVAIGWLVITALLFHYRSPLLISSFNITLAYGIFVFAYHPKLQVNWFHKLGDYSYGLYIYAFPIQQFLKLKFPLWGVAVNFGASFLLTLILAALSWYFVEKPMLKLKMKPLPKAA